MNDYRRVSVPVRGGDLAVGVWGADLATPVLAVHGVSASHRSWSLVAAQLPSARVIAPDLRGRGRSSALPGPFGLKQHADDLAAVLDAVGVDRVVLLGHSMGAFVALVFAHLHPDRVSALVLVDGGFPLPPVHRNGAESAAAETDAELTTAVLGPAVTRLSMTFTSRAEYADFWRQHPAFANDWNDAVADYVDYDLTGNEPELHPAASFDAVAEDSAELRGGSSIVAALDALRHPTAFLRAPRGLMNEPTALYSPQDVELWRERYPHVLAGDVENVNHYTILMAERGAKAVAQATREAMERCPASY